MPVTQMTQEADYTRYQERVAAGEADVQGWVPYEHYEHKYNDGETTYVRTPHWYDGKPWKVTVRRTESGAEEGITHGRACSCTARPGEDQEFTPGCLIRKFDRDLGKTLIIKGGEVLGESKDLDYDVYRDCCIKRKPLWMETKYVGCVIGTGERNGYHDSDFTAHLWMGEDYETIVYATTRGWTYPNNAKADLSGENKAAYDAYRAAKAAAAKAERARAQAEREDLEAHMPSKFAVVRVQTGRMRGLSKGMVGIVLWEGHCNYSGEVKVGVWFGDQEGDQKQLVFKARSGSKGLNFRAILPGEEGYESRPDFVKALQADREAQAAQKAAREARSLSAADALCLNQWVTVTAGKNTGKEGLAFFIRDRDGLVGIALTNEKAGSRFACKVWAAADEVKVDESRKPAWARRYKVRG